MKESKPTSKLARRLPLALGICMVLGSFGSCKGMTDLSVWNEPITISLPKLTPAAEETTEEWERLDQAWGELEEAQNEAFRLHRPATNALAVVNLFSSLVLMFGAMGTGARLGRGLPTLRAGLVLSQAYVILALAVGTWVQLGLLESAQTALTPVRAIEGLPGQTATVALIAFWVGVPLSIAALGGQFLFYLWMQRTLKKPEALEAFGPPTP